MNVTSLMPLIYPFIRYFMEKLLLGRLIITLILFEPELAVVLNFLYVPGMYTPPPNIL